VQVTCPYCGSLMSAPDGAKSLTCASCGQKISSAPDSEALTHGPSDSSSLEDAPTFAGPQIRLNCPQCHKEITMPADEPPGKCPRCGFSLEAAVDNLTRTGAGRKPVVKAAVDVTTGVGRAITKEEAPGEAALQWIRTHLGKKYEILEFVARGGMGAVYKAKQRQPERIVALKMMLGGAFAGDRHRRRFEREAQSVARLNHPAIVPVFEYGEAGGQPYFTMEFVEGLDLLTYVRLNVLSTEEICRMMVRVCDAVHYAHSYGIVHRDLKPGNILVDNLNRPRILDFGLSRPMMEEEGERSLLTVTGDFLGTPRYMSPEQAAGRPKLVDERTDVYALGLILYELVVGMPPYPLEHARGADVFKMIQTAEPISPSALVPAIQEDLETIILKAIEKDKLLRYQTAGDLALDLENFLADRPIMARPATTWYRVRKWGWRNRRVLLPVVLSSMVLAVVSGVLLKRLVVTSRTLEETVAGLERALAGQDEARQWLGQLVSNGMWAEAVRFAAFAEERIAVKGLTWKVQRSAQKQVSEASREFLAAVRDQRYEEAGKMAAELTALRAALSPLPELQDMIGDVEPGFAERCWQELQAGLDAAYRRDDARQMVEQFLARFPDGPHASEAQGLMDEVAARTDEYYLGQHGEAFAAAMAACDWQRAQEILDSAAVAASSDADAGSSERREKFAALQLRLDSTIRPSNAARLKPLRSIKESGVPVKSVTFAPAGDILAVTKPGEPVGLWGTTTWALVREIPVAGVARRATISPDGRLIAIGFEGGTTDVWLLEGLQRFHELAGHTGRVNTVEFSPDGTRLLTADAEKAIIWNVESGKALEKGTLEGEHPAAFSPDGTIVATALDKQHAGLWDVKSGILVQTLAGAKPLRLAFSPDGSLLATAHVKSGLRDVALWDVLEGKTVAQMIVSVGKEPLLKHAVWGLTFSPDGRLLVTGDVEPSLKVWDVGTAQRLAAFPCEADPYAAAFSPDSRLLVIGQNDGAVSVWDIPAPEATEQADGTPSAQGT